MCHKDRLDAGVPQNLPPLENVPPGGEYFLGFPGNSPPPGEYFLGKFAPQGGIFPRKNTPPPGKSAPPPRGGGFPRNLYPPGDNFPRNLYPPGGNFPRNLYPQIFFFLKKCQYPLSGGRFVVFTLRTVFPPRGVNFPTKIYPPGGKIS